MKKKYGLIAFVALTLGSLVASCGGSATDNGDDDGGDTPVVTDYFIDTPTSITLSTTAGDSNLAILQKFADAFTANVEPNVTVTLNQVSGSYSDLATKVTSGFKIGSYPDMVMVYPDAVADFMDYGYTYDLTPYITNEEYGWTDEDIADIIPAFLEEGQQYVIDGTYSLPFSKSTEVVYYNKAIIGLELSGANNGDPITQDYLDNLTWEEFFDNLCPAILAYNESADSTKKIISDTSTKGQYAVLGYDSDANLFITLAKQYGYDYTGIKDGVGQALFVNDGMKGLIKQFSDYNKKGYILSYKGTGNRANSYFTANETVFSVGSTGGASYQFSTSNPMDIGVFALPRPENKEAYQILQGPSMAFLAPNKPDSSKADEVARRKLASRLFYKYMTNEENSFTWATGTGYTPIRNSTYQNQDYMELNDESSLTSKTLDMLLARIANYLPKIKDNYFTSPAFKGSNTCRDQVDALMGKALTYGTGTVASDEDINTRFGSAYTECVKAIS
jgi:multiple sugar transport system substrate-binding protein